jgi:hypothetical protein
VYLPDEAAAHAILRDAAEIAAPGSMVGLDVTGKSFLDSPSTKTYRNALTARGVVWSYGTDQPEELLKRAGWTDVRALQPHELGFAEGRWPYPPTPRHVEGVPRSYFVEGRK